MLLKEIRFSASFKSLRNRLWSRFQPSTTATLIVSTIEKDVCLLLHLAKVAPTSTTSETTTEKKPTKAKGPQGEEGGRGGGGDAAMKKSEPPSESKTTKIQSTC